MPEDLHSEVVHHPLAQIGGQQGLAIFDQELQQERTSKEQGEGAEQAGVPSGDGNIQCPLGEDRPHESEPCSRQEQQHGCDSEATVWSEIGEQAPQEAGVVALLEDFILVHTLPGRLGQRRVFHSLETPTHPA
jgi:hypothetical protein